MTNLLQDKIIQSLQTAEGLYYRLVLLVGETGSGKTEILRHIAGYFGTEVININLALSAQLLELTAKQRVLHLSGILAQILDQAKPIVVLDNLEILFDKNLKQDPLRLLQGISRHRSVLASWNGSITGGKLNYAEAGHSEYRSYDLADTLSVGMDGTSTVDSLNNIKSIGQA